MRSTGKSHKGNGKSGQDGRKDRRSATGMSGSPKKGGHGGKFTWVGDRFSVDEIGLHEVEAAVDAKDPNFEDPDQEEENMVVNSGGVNRVM